MNVFSSLIFAFLSLASSARHIYMAIKRKEAKILCMQIGILGLAIAGGILSIYHVPEPSIAKMLGAVIPRVN